MVCRIRRESVSVGVIRGPDSVKWSWTVATSRANVDPVQRALSIGVSALQNGVGGNGQQQPVFDIDAKATAPSLLFSHDLVRNNGALHVSVSLRRQ